MLYRFVTSGEAIEWIAAQLGLEKMKIESPDQLPLEFLKDRPSWWQPERRKPKKYFYSVEKFKSGGLRQVVLVFDAASGFTYIVEHYSDMPGI